MDRHAVLGRYLADITKVTMGELVKILTTLPQIALSRGINKIILGCTVIRKSFIKVF
jgi:hypothetical protein